MTGLLRNSLQQDGRRTIQERRPLRPTRRHLPRVILHDVPMGLIGRPATTSPCRISHLSVEAYLQPQPLARTGCSETRPSSVRLPIWESSNGDVVAGDLAESVDVCLYKVLD